MKETFVLMLIEAVIFLLPLITFIFKVGSWRGKLENDIAKLQDEVKTLWKELGAIEAKGEDTKNVVAEVKESLAAINSKLDLIVNGKIKIGE